MNKTGSTIFHSLLLATSGLVGSTLLASTAAMAAGGGPTGGTVAVGSATIINASPTQTVVNQSSKKALINWNSFSVPGGSSVKFNQPNSKSLTVNRVTGANASIIDGQILATGNVWLINANGVLFGKGSQINVGALLATTSDLSDDDFKNGNYNFKAAANPNAAVVNKGTITAGANGSVVLSAPRVSNEGLIHADFGTVVLGGANAFTVDMTGDNLLRYEITAPVTAAPKDGNGNLASALVSNSGAIEAAGGHVMMTARAARNIENNVINNTGMVEATTVSSHNGEIDLDAGPDGTVNDSGTLNTSGAAQGQAGGTVNVTGGTVNVADGAKINASGDAGGGTVQIGGGLHGGGTLAHAQRTVIGNATISADATGKGNGGTVAVWSDGDTSFAGSISAKGGAQGGNGGQVETSGEKVDVGASVHVDTGAPLGLNGDWLLDPTDILITSCISQSACCGSTTCLAPSTITSGVVGGDFTEAATNSLTVDTGSDIIYSSANKLTLQAGGDLTIGSQIANSGTGAVELDAGNSIFVNSPIGTLGSLTLHAGDSQFGGTGNAAIFDSGAVLLSGSTIDLINEKGGSAQEAIGTLSDPIAVATNHLLVDAATDDVYIDATGGLNIGDGSSGIHSNSLTLTASGDVTQTGAIQVGALSVTTTGTDHSAVLTDASNDVTGAISLNTTGDAALTNADAISLAASTVGGTLTLTADGDVTQTGAISATGLSVTTAGANQNIALTDPGNDVTGSISFDTTGDAALTNADAISLAASTIGGTLTLIADGDVTQTGAISAGGLSVSNVVSHESITLTDSGNDISGDISLNTFLGDAALTNAAAISLGASSVGGNLILVADGSISQTGAISATGLSAANTGSGSGITLTNAGNHITGAVLLNTDGNASLVNADDTILGVHETPQDDTPPNFVVGGNLSVTVVDGGSLTLAGRIHANGAGETTLQASGDINNDDNGDGTIIADNLNLISSCGSIGAGPWSFGLGAPGTDTLNLHASAFGDITINPGDLNIGTSQGGLSAGGNILIFGNGAITQNSGVNGEISADSIDFHSAGDITLNNSLNAVDSVAFTTTGDVSFVDSTSMTVNALKGVSGVGMGDVCLATDGSLTVADGAEVDPSGNIVLVATGAIDIESSIQNSGSGDITLVAGADPSLLTSAADVSSILTNDEYGNFGGNITIGGATSGNVAVGSKNGTTTILGGDIKVAGDVNSVTGKYAQIGYHGTGGGDIVIFGTGNLSMAGNLSQTGQIGNGGFSGSGITGGAVTGNVTVTVSGNITDNSTASRNWIGNTAKAGSIEAGNVTLSMFSGTFNGVDIAVDLGTTTGTGGNVFLGFTSQNDTPFEGIASYSSVNSFTIAAAGNLLLEGNIQNSSTGAINLIGGWDGATADGTLFTNPATYGNNDGGVVFGSETNSVAVGGKGLVTVEGDDVELDGDGFTTQLGFAGTGGGNIVIRALGDLSLNGGEGTSNAVQIGNGATFNSAAAGGNISISTRSLSTFGEADIAGNSLSITATGGQIGSLEDPLIVAANYLAISETTSCGTASAFISSPSGGLSIGYGGNGIQIVGGDLTLTAGGTISQTAAINVGDASIIATGGDIVLNKATNQIASADLSATGNITLYDGSSLELNGATVGGNFTVLTTGDLTITDDVQLNSGSLVAIAGWDGTTTNFTSLAASSSAYGRNSGDVVIGGEDAADDVSVGSKSGTTTVAGANVTVSAVNGSANIGYSGSGTGNITVLAKNDILVVGNTITVGEGINETFLFGSIGNGDGFTSGNVKGDIAITAGGETTVVEDNEGRVGNFAAEGSSSTGNVTIITNSGNLSGEYLGDDLKGGNVFVGFTGTSGDYDLDGLGTYNSSHTFTWAAAANLDVNGSVQNSGSGAVNLIAGWDGRTTDLASLTNTGVYGNNGGILSIFAGEGTLAVGSKSGKTTVAGYDIDLDASTGGAVQVGYHGSGATGAINVVAAGDVNLTGGEGSVSVCGTFPFTGIAQIGNGGTDVNGAVGGNITVTTAGGDINVIAGGSSSIAEIGNIAGNNGSETGNIVINTHGGDVTVQSDGGGEEAYSDTTFAQIGNWTDGTSTGGSSGNIKINAGNILVKADGNSASADIGNGNYFGAAGQGAISGNIAISATTLTLQALSPDSDTFEEARVGNLGLNGAVSGNVGVVTTGDILVDAEGPGAASIGNYSNPRDTNNNLIPGLNTGNVSVQAGGNITVSSDGISAYASIENGGPSGSNGTVTVNATGNILESASDGAGALIGTLVFGKGGENISVTSTNGYIEVESLGNGSFAQIGNIEALTGGTIGGNVSVVAASVANGSVILHADSTAINARIGNDGPTVSGSVSIVAGKQLEVDNSSLATIGNFGAAHSGDVSVIAGVLNGDLDPSLTNDLFGGNVTLATTNASQALTIGGIHYTSGTTLTVLSAGNLNVTGDIENSGTGNIMLVAGWKPSVAPSNVAFTSGAYGNSNATLTVGGSGSSGNTSVGSAKGVTTVLTKNLNVTAVNGTAELGYNGAASGNIVVAATGNIAVVGKSSSTFAEIGNLGSLNQTVSGNITIADVGSFTLTNGILGNAVLGTSVATGSAVLTAGSFSSSGASLISGSSADLTLTGAGAGIGSAGNALNTVVGAIAVQTNNGSVFIAAPQSALSIGVGSRGVNLGTGSLTLTTGGAITQTAAIKAAAVNLSATSGAISLTNAANAFGAIVLSTKSDATIADAPSLTIGTAAVGGNLTLLSKGNLIFTQSIQLLKGALVAVAGWNGSGTTAASGTYGKNGGSITIGGSGASDDVAVGSASGAVTLAGADIDLQAVNGFAQIGYHGGGSGAINVLAADDVTLNGGGSSDFFAQIGDGGFNVAGSSSSPITVQASGDVALNAGAGQEAYAQIGNGGAESNSNSSGYSETGLVTVSGETVTLDAGSGSGSYAQIGHGGYKSGQSLNGIATLGGDISVNAADMIHLNGGGDDAYAQIGHGGDFLNTNAANGASGALSGNITVNVVAANTPTGGDPLTLTAGTGTNSYTQIGNGGQGENAPVSGATVTFDIGGNVTVADLTLTGSNTGANGYSQVGNGDASKTGTGDVSGQVTLGSGTTITNVPGSAPGASTGMGNSTGDGTVTGTILTSTNGIGAGTQGSVASITQNPVGPTNFNITTVTVTPENTQYQFNNNTTGPQGPTPLEQLADQSNSEGKTTSDSVAQSVGQSLGDGKTIYVTSKTLIPGMLKQIVTLTRNNPNGVPPADEDYSSWGNEALWRW